MISAQISARAVRQAVVQAARQQTRGPFVGRRHHRGTLVSFSSLAAPVLSEAPPSGTSRTYVPPIQSFSTLAASGLLPVADEAPQEAATNSSRIVLAFDFTLSCPEDDDDGG